MATTTLNPSPQPIARPASPSLSALRHVVVRIGVTGHRSIADGKLASVEERIRIVLRRIKLVAQEVAASWPIPDAQAVLRVISPLAEGVDQLVAVVAAEPEFAADLQCVLPSYIDDYLSTFSAEGPKTEFHRLLEGASAIVELDGRLAKGDAVDNDEAEAESLARQQSYSRVGDVVLQNCDVLIAVLDPKQTHRPGGTAEIMGLALGEGQLVVWIDPDDPEVCGPLVGLMGRQFQEYRSQPHRFPSLLRSHLRPLENLAKPLRASLALTEEEQGSAQSAPGHHSHATPRQPDLLQDYLKEALPRGKLCRALSKVWNLLVWEMIPSSGHPSHSRHGLVKKLNLPWSVLRHNAARLGAWRSERADRSTSTPASSDDPRQRVGSAVKAYEPYRKHASELSRHYAGLHRSAFFVIAMLGVTAVALPLISWVQEGRDKNHPRNESHQAVAEPSMAGRQEMKPAASRNENDQAAANAAPPITPSPSASRLFRVAATVREKPWITGEMVVIGFMILIHVIHQLMKWHQKSLDYRLLAERLRHIGAMSVLARSAQFFPFLPAQYSHLRPQDSWVERYFRAVVRQVGLTLGTVPDAKGPLKVVPLSLDRAYLDACRDHLRQDWIEGQIKYHERNTTRAESLHELAELIIYLLLVGTILACALHLLGIEHVLLYPLAVFLPALGGALHSVTSQAEVARLAQRSDAMALKLREISAQMENLPLDFSSEQLAELVDSAGDVLLAEVGEWRVLFQLHPPHTPG
jgi:hypothetical protein